ncbi:MAG TPA: tetratricopeptide repeat protein [Acidobacteriota bacterium]
MRLRAGILGLVIALLAAGSWAQEGRGRGRASGMVFDAQTKAPLEGVKVVAKAEKFTFEPDLAVSDAEGKWTIPFLGLADWEFTFFKPGYKPFAVVIRVSQVKGTKLPPVLLEVAEAGAPGSTEQPGAAKLAEGQELLRQNQFEAARSAFEASLAEDPNSLAAHYLIGQTYKGEGKFAQALNAYQEVLAVDPTNPSALLAAGEVLIRSGKLEEGMASLNKMESLEPADAEVLYPLGADLFNSNDMASARDVFELALRADPEHVPSLLQLAIIEAAEGNNEQAKTHFQRVLELAAPDSMQAAQAQEFLKSIQ